MDTVTFRVGGRDGRAVIASLNELGFTFDSPRAETTTVLDTFDGRVHRAGLQLTLHDAETLELELSGEDVVPAHLAVDARPRVPTDLPPGPLRSRIDDLTEPRALLSRLQISARRSTGVCRDGTGKVVATADVHDAIQVVDRPDVEAFTTIEIHAVPGYGKHFRRVLATLRRVGVTDCEGDTVSQSAAVAEVDLAGFTAAPTVPLDPGMAAIDGFRDVLANLVTTIDANWQGTVDQTDSVFLHQLRIAVRRTRTILANAKPVIPPSVRDPTREGFAWLASMTGPPRDLDVYLLEWTKYTEPLGPEAAAQLTPVHDLLERRCTEAHVALEHALGSQRAIELLDGWRTWLDDPLGGDELPKRAERPLGRFVAKRIARAHGELVDKGRLIGPDSPAEQVHDLRKDAKKLRYLLECFGGMLPGKATKRYVKRLKALQDNLGEHQDAEVHIALLRDITNELDESGADARTIGAVDQLTERLEHQRRAARSEFAERFTDYDSPTTRRALDAVLEAIRS